MIDYIANWKMKGLAKWAVIYAWNLPFLSMFLIFGIEAMKIWQFWMFFFVMSLFSSLVTERFEK